jgi:sec-independent protein translocase protein TatB
MFEVGFTEIVLIFALALVVLGPARLPTLAADVGRWAGRARAMARQLKTQLEQETRFDPLADPKPNPASGSQTIHPQPAPSDDARAAPAQLAAAATPLNPADAASLTPDKTATDEPKSV